MTNKIQLVEKQGGNKYIITGFWGELKRGIKGIYHWASHKHIQKYCNEFSYRYNNRNLKNNERFVDFLSGLANTKLTYKTLTA